jgi:hypothetical protein
MKTALLLVLSFLNSANTTTAQQVTNYVAAAGNFRVVDGVTYNIDKSVLWQFIEARCVEVLTNGIIVQEEKVIREYAPNEVSSLQQIGAYGSPPGRHVISEKVQPGKKIFIRNYPLSARPSIGQQINVKALPVARTKHGETWDFGTAYMVPVVTKNKSP